MTIDCTASAYRSVALGHDAHTTETGEWAWGIRGEGTVLQIYPDGRILVRGRPPASDAEVVAVLREVVAAHVRSGTP